VKFSLLKSARTSACALNLVVKHSPDKRRANRGEKEPGEKFRI